mmetsp:Transcript_45719/g.117460  ORF Transcript_45719/g.117460 Transcript_45719/m.117460 type:complete len:108 (-) Transcript_45719:29-352(-)
MRAQTTSSLDARLAEPRRLEMWDRYEAPPTRAAGMTFDLRGRHVWKRRQAMSVPCMRGPSQHMSQGRAVGGLPPAAVVTLLSLSPGGGPRCCRCTRIGHTVDRGSLV